MRVNGPGSKYTGTGIDVGEDDIKNIEADAKMLWSNNKKYIQTMLTEILCEKAHIEGWGTPTAADLCTDDT